MITLAVFYQKFYMQYIFRQELDLSSSTQLPSTRLPDKRLAPFQHKPELIQPLMESNIVRTGKKKV